MQSLLIVVLQSNWGALTGPYVWALAGLVLVTSTATALGLIVGGMYVARRAFDRQARRTEEAYAQLTREDGAKRLYQARMHELTSTVAGVRSASDLLVANGGMDQERRAGLQAMINAELHRLERMLQAPPRCVEDEVEPDVVDVDAVLRTLETAHEAKGTVVRRQVSGELALGCIDDFAEAINVLLDNAARHGDGTATIDVRADEGAAVEVRVSDGGSGVAADVRGRLFEWGGRGAASPGQGIGLHVARTLMERQGGYLRLAEAGGDGGRTTFAVGIPALRAEDLVDEITVLACEIGLGVADGVPA